MYFITSIYTQNSWQAPRIVFNFNMGLLFACFRKKTQPSSDIRQSPILIRPIFNDDDDYNSERPRYTVIFDANKGCRRLARTMPIRIPYDHNSPYANDYRQSLKARLEVNISLRRKTKKVHKHPLLSDKESEEKSNNQMPSEQKDMPGPPINKAK